LVANPSLDTPARSRTVAGNEAKAVLDGFQGPGLSGLGQMMLRYPLPEITARCACGITKVTKVREL